MSLSITAFNHHEWERYRLANYEDFAEQTSECNVGEDTFSGFGEWFFIPDERLPNNDAVIYFGTWGNDHSPGASSYTHAEIFDMDAPDDAAEYHKRVREWKRQPQFVDAPDTP